VRSFYIRRILRIWPLYFLGLLIAVPYRMRNPPARLPPKYAEPSSSCGELAALYPVGDVAPMDVSFEEQFYLLWPALMSHRGTFAAETSHSLRSGALC